MTTNNTFDLVFLIARPAAGKSEVIDHLKKTNPQKRQELFHIGDFEEFDDFPYVWQMFEEDKIMQKHGRQRIWTDEKNYFKDAFTWNVLIEKLNCQIANRRLENPSLFQTTTAVVEFARGGKQGFAEAFSHVDSDLLKRGAVLYIDVSYEESKRKNQRRAVKGQEHSILHHSLPDDKMEFYYKENDFAQLAEASPTHLKLQNIDVPYVILKNEPEVTNDPKLLDEALRSSLQQLWSIYTS